MSDPLPFAPAQPLAAAPAPLHSPEDGSAEPAYIDLVASPSIRPESKAKRGARAARGSERVVARRAISVFTALKSAVPADVGVVRALLGAGPSAGFDELAVAAIAPSSASSQAIADVRAILTAPPTEAGIIAAAMERARLRQAWRLFNGLGVVGQDMPSSEAKAAIALVRSIEVAGREEIEGDLARGLALIGRGA